MDEAMSRTKSKWRATKKFFTQFSFAAIAVTVLWFAGVGFSRTVLSRPLGGDESASNDKHFSVPKGFKFPKGFVPQPGQTYIKGKNGSGPVLIHLSRGDAAMDWQSWMSPLHIILLIVLIVFVLAQIDRGLRNSRRRRVMN
jgi:hypothetical protein